ncbi:hypothetical protein AB9E23_24660 [Rhizobium leguminosarum]
MPMRSPWTSIRSATCMSCHIS